MKNAQYKTQYKIYIFVILTLLISMQLAFALSFSTAPKIARAADSHSWSHGEDVQDGATLLNSDYLATSSNSLQDGNYYLNQDLELTSTIYIEDAVELCLNGFRISITEQYSEIFSINQEYSLTLYDCESGTCQQHQDDSAHKGEITGAQDASAIRVSGGTFTMYGGKICENSAMDAGGGVHVENGTFIMNGGEISGNTAENGGGISVKNGTITINGGSIINNNANATSGMGGGVYLDATNPYDNNQQPITPSAHFTLADGAIIGGNSALKGGGVAMVGGVTAEMTGGVIGGKISTDGTTINGNTAEKSGNNEGYGDGVYMESAEVNIENQPQTFSPTFTMSNGVIGFLAESDADVSTLQGVVGNSATSGGGVYFKGGTFTMNGGTIGIDGAQPQENTVVGNKATKDANTGGGGVFVADNSTFTMTNGKISYNADSDATFRAAGVYVANDANTVPEKFATFEMSGGEVSNNETGAGIMCANGGQITVSGSAQIKNNYYGIGIYSGGQVNISGGEITECYGGVYFMGGWTITYNAIIELTGGRITNNETGIYFPLDNLTLGGDAYVLENVNQNGEASNIVVNGFKIKLNPDFNGRVGVSLEKNDEGFTEGYVEGMENCFTLDSPEGATIKPMQLVVWDDELSDTKTVTELALTYSLTFLIDGVPVEGISTDYVAGAYLHDYFYEYNEQQESVLKPEVAQLFVKAPDDQNHYTFKEFTDEQGLTFDLSSARLDENKQLNVVFDAQEHTYPDYWTPGDDAHTKQCDGCEYVQSEAHHWGAWAFLDDANHSHECSDCGAQETAAHDYPEVWQNKDADNHSKTCADCQNEITQGHEWGGWQSLDDTTHRRVCTVANCDAEQTGEHTYSGDWVQGDDAHTKDCDTCDYVQSEGHDWGAWEAVDDTNHRHACNICSIVKTESHNYPDDWSYKDGDLHDKTCPDCSNVITQQHVWGDWYETVGDTLTRDCDSCSAQESIADESKTFNDLFDSFNDLTGDDGAALDDALDHYNSLGEDEKKYLDEAAQKQDYSNFAGMVDDMKAKTEFEAEREEPLKIWALSCAGATGIRCEKILNLLLKMSRAPNTSAAPTTI